MADVTFTFSGDASELNAALSEIKQEVSKTKEAVGGMAGKFAIAFAAIQAGIAAVKSAFSSLGEISSAAAAMEQTSLAFTVMMGDAATAAVDVPQGCDFSIPYIIDHSTVTPVLRLRTEEDDLVDAVCQCDKFPTKRAIRMANAIMLERLLVTGKYGSATNMARLIGVSQPHVTQLLNMLNLPPAEIEAILFETV